MKYFKERLTSPSMLSILEFAASRHRRPFTTQDILDRLDISGTLASHDVRRLEEHGLIRHVGKIGRTNYYAVTLKGLYYITRGMGSMVLR